MPATLGALSWEAMTVFAVITLEKQCLGKHKMICSEEHSIYLYRWEEETLS